MAKIKMISAGEHYTAATIGKLDGLGEYVYSLPSGMEIPGKVFIGEALQCTGTEVSFQLMPPGGGIDFLHTHRQNEELYIVLKGNGEYQVDGQLFPVGEGDIVRVAAPGKRSWRNTGKEPVIMLVIQSKSGSLSQLEGADGVLVKEPPRWE